MSGIRYPFYSLDANINDKESHRKQTAYSSTAFKILLNLGRFAGVPMDTTPQISTSPFFANCGVIQNVDFPMLLICANFRTPHPCCTMSSSFDNPPSMGLQNHISTHPISNIEKIRYNRFYW